MPSRAVETSRTTTKPTDTSTQIELGSNPATPGRTMIITPTKPTAIAIHRRGPTFSPRNSAAAAVIASGVA